MSDVINYVFLWWRIILVVYTDKEILVCLSVVSQILLLTYLLMSRHYGYSIILF